MTRNQWPLLRLLRYGRSHWRTIQIASLCSILNKFFDLAPPVLIGMAVDAVSQPQKSVIAQWGIVDIRQQLVIICGLSVVIWGLESAFEYAYARLWRNLAQTIEHELRLDGYNHLQNLEMAFFEEQNSGSLMSILNDDINQLERFLDKGANEVLQVIVTILLVGGTFFVVAPGIAWTAVVPMPFIVWGAIAFQKLLAPRYAQVRERVSFLNSRLSNNLGGITTIKSFTTEEYETEQVRQDSEAYRQSNREAIALSAAFVPLIRILILIAFIVTLGGGGLLVVQGSLSVGNYSVLIYLIQRLLWPLTRLGETLDQYQRAMASTQRVMNLLDTPLAIASGTRSLPVSQVQGSITFEDIYFAYQPDYPVVKHLSLQVPAGHSVGIVGATGSGKSTLVKLLLRFYEAQSGDIFLDGIPIHELHLQDLRRAIGLVSQDVFLFHGTVRENIAYARPDASFSDVVIAAKHAEAAEFIEQLPQGYDTIIGERGQKLSGGQRQRLAIARALLKDPPILILDEATSAVDNETEAAIQKSLEFMTKGRTTIAIAHRLSTIRHSDCIYVMEYGQIVEQGKHEELLVLNGIYAELWNIQTGQRSG
jgi:ATP-binding cassette, subfamily B, bacterial